MATYVLLFDPTGRNPERIVVPEGKRVYLARAPQVAEGTATVQDVAALTSYVLPDGVTVCQTPIAEHEEIALAFMARTNDQIHSINVEVISPREGIDPCTS